MAHTGWSIAAARTARRLRGVRGFVRPDGPGGQLVTFDETPPRDPPGPPTSRMPRDALDERLARLRRGLDELEAQLLAAKADIMLLRGLLAESPRDTPADATPAVDSGDDRQPRTRRRQARPGEAAVERRLARPLLPPSTGR